MYNISNETNNRAKNMKIEFLKQAQIAVDNNTCEFIYDTDIQTFADLFGLKVEYSAEFAKRMKQHYSRDWDNPVTGERVSVYALDGQIVATSTKGMRRSKINKEHIAFVSAGKQLLTRVVMINISKSEQAWSLKIF
jgi:hypothetical protein